MHLIEALEALKASVASLLLVLVIFVLVLVLTVVVDEKAGRAVTAMIRVVAQKARGATRAGTMTKYYEVTVAALAHAPAAPPVWFEVWLHDKVASCAVLRNPRPRPPVAALQQGLGSRNARRSSW